MEAATTHSRGDDTGSERCPLYHAKIVGRETTCGFKR